MGVSRLPQPMSKQYPSDWDQRRKKVYQRDNYTCQNCGARGGPKGDYELHAHHIVPKSKGGTHKISNLKTMCEYCHSAIHNDVMAPTASKRESPRFQSRSGAGEDDRELVTGMTEQELISQGTFTYCPICSSREIGVGDQEYEICCDECGLELKREKHGLSVENINSELFEEDSAFSRIDEYTLAEPAWFLVTKADDGEVDFSELEKKSRKYNKNMERIRNSHLPSIVLVCGTLGVLILLNYILPTFLAWASTLVLLLGFAFALTEKNDKVKMFIFNISN